MSFTDMVQVYDGNKQLDYNKHVLAGVLILHSEQCLIIP